MRKTKIRIRKESNMFNSVELEIFKLDTEEKRKYTVVKLNRKKQKGKLS